MAAAEEPGAPADARRRRAGGRGEHFTAGAILSDTRATVLTPGLVTGVVRHSACGVRGPLDCGPGIRLVTAFRLPEWQGKGLRQLVGAR